MFPIQTIEAKKLDLTILNEIYPPLEKLFYRGDISVLKRKTFAIVGARAAGSYSRREAILFARGLSKHGYTIISGLARGIDGAAHYGALLGGAPTVAILGSGLDRIYPAEHRGLADQIVEKGGCVISEYLPDSSPRKMNFPLRNRLIAAFSSGVLVIQARKKSGSLITAKCALELGKDVFILPGPIEDGSFEGGHSLVQEGAKLVQNLEDILCEMPSEIPSPESAWETLFRSNGGILTLEEIFGATHLPLSVLLEEIERYKALGLLLELFPQQYSWITGVKKEIALPLAAMSK